MKPRELITFTVARKGVRCLVFGMGFTSYLACAPEVSVAQESWIRDERWDMRPNGTPTCFLCWYHGITTENWLRART